MKYVAGFGILNCDLLYSGLKRLPGDGEEVFSSGFDIQLGGGIAAILINLARLNVPVKCSTFLGKGLFSDILRRSLDNYGLEYQNLYEGEEEPITITSVAVTPNDRTFISYSGKVDFTEKVQQRIIDQMREAAIIRMSNVQFELYKKIKEENPAVTLVMDTGWGDDLSIEQYRKYFELADFYIPNKKEALKVTGTENIVDASQVLSGFFDTVIIKLGPEGCLLRQNDCVEIIAPPDDIEAIDSTGAGDAFAAGFIYGLFHEYPLRDCVIFGNITGSECVRKIGCLPGYVIEEELIKKMEDLRGKAVLEKEN